MFMKKIIMHIDVNNAFLSWTAVKLLDEGYKIDIRTIPAVIGGDESKRHGIVLAKSPIAKKMGVKSAETIYMARKKCPYLEIGEKTSENFKNIVIARPRVIEAIINTAIIVTSGPYDKLIESKTLN